MKLLKPTWYCAQITEIDFSILKQKGIDTILCDLDNTLVPVNCAHVDEVAKKVLDNINNANLKCHVISNNHYDRVSTFCEGTNVSFLNDAHKPATSRINAYIEEKGIDKTKTVLIGDQLITDIILANKLNIKSLLVEPRAKKDLPVTFINRFLDRIIRSYNLKRNKYMLLGDKHE